MERRDDDRTASALGGDEAALDWLVGRWLPQVYAWCARFGAPEPQESATDVLLLLVQRRHRVRGPDHLPAWLLAACRRVVANHRRRVWWRRWVPGVALDAWASPSRTDARLEQAELADQVGGALDRLRAQHREVLVLCYVEERSVGEAAELLGIPVGTVKSRLFAARAQFAAEWGGRE